MRTPSNKPNSQIRNNQLKLQWELKCQKLTEAGILCGDRPWKLCDQKCGYILQLSIGTDGRRLLTQKFRHDNIYDLSTTKLLEMMEIAFIQPRNITFDCYVFFSKKQKKCETVKQFHSVLNELTENCDFENREEVIIGDIFITNMLDDDIQREILRDTVEREKALRIAVNMEMVHQNPQRISYNNNNFNSSSAINAIQQFSRYRGDKFNSAGLCRGCGQHWTSTHRQVSPALGKKCNHYGLLNHFAKVCRKNLNNPKNCRQDTRINNAENSETTEQSESKNVNFVNHMSSIILKTICQTITMLQWWNLLMRPQSFCKV